MQKRKQKRELEDCGLKRTVFIQFKDTVHIHSNYGRILSNGGLKALAQRRLRILEATDPFSGCRGLWHRFSCGHQFKVLCSVCAEAWDTGNYPHCEPKVLARPIGDLKDNLYWPKLCSECEGIPHYNPSWAFDDAPVDMFCVITLFMALKLEYLDEEGLRSTSRASFYRIPMWNRWGLPMPSEEFGKQHSCKGIDTE